ncbi:MAG TPA: PP2C family protein-serine/threonine phosphatase [Acidimicrobiales bacterium]|nr:PP2C family protein-serine/threonine phosphatase [Acidimicrobiales bacterium]
MSENAAASSRRARLHLVPIVLLLLSLGVTALGAAAAQSSHDDTEDRLLAERVEAGASVFMGTLPSLISPLEGTAALAEATDADEDALRDFLEPQVGEEGRFDSVSVWSLDDLTPLLVVGGQPHLSDRPAGEIGDFFARTTGEAPITVFDLLDRDDPSLGYALRARRPDAAYVVYAENVLPADRTSNERVESPFQDLDYALYLGNEPTEEGLLIANTDDLPLDGRTDQTTVPFGDEELLLVLHPQGKLSGTLSGQIPWLILLFGSVLALLFAVLLERLLRRRDRALALAEENRRLYDEQRSVADAVQHSLLPASLPEIEGLELEVRYRPGVRGTEVGGDWYDVVASDDEHLLVVVGDVAGRGLRAATVMAMLRHATRAYALDGVEAADLPGKLTRLMRADEGSGFATVLLLLLDLPARTVTVVNAGHPRPLLLDGERRFLDAPVGLPVGVVGDRGQGSIDVAVPPGATLLAFTDGLFERRGESVDEGMERLRTAVDPDRPLGEVLDGLLEDLSTGAEADDVAIVGVRW